MARAMFEPVFREGFPFWDTLCEDDRTYLCENTVAMTYPKGTSVHDGSCCTGVLFLRKGCLRVYMLSEEGKEITLYRLHGGDLCMLAASCVLQSVTFDVFIDAQENSECYVISGPAFAYFADNNPEVKIFALEMVASRFSEVMWVMQQILFMSMDRRLAIFLWDESARLGSDVIPLTHEQIAKYMGSAREVVSRMLKYFASEGIISSSRSEGIKILDKKRLRNITI
jgi:CRP/FNR family transcriptional regulator